MRYFLHLIWIGLFFPTILWGQTQTYWLGLPPIVNYAKSDYEGETQNWAVSQDPRGLMYFGNNLGLLEFDGTSWKSYPLPNKSIIRSLAVDSLGRIIVGGQGEFGYFTGDQKGRLVYQSLVDQIPAKFRNFDDVWQVFITDEATFWGTQKALYYQTTSGIEVYASTTRFDKFFLVNEVLYVDEKGKGLLRWEGDAFELVPSGEQLRNYSISAILPGPEAGLVIATAEQGMFLLADGNLTPWGIDIRTYLIENRIYDALHLSNGNYAIGTSHDGLVILNPSGAPERILNKSVGLQNNSVLSLYEDRQGDLWLGLENGISHIEIRSPFLLINSQSGVAGTAYASQVHDNKLFLATNQGIFYRPWPEKASPILSEKFILLEGSKGPTWTLQTLGDMLIAGKHKGAFTIENTRMNQVSTVNGAWKFLVLNHHPTLAIGGTYTGLVLFEQQPDGKTWRFKKELTGFQESSRVLEQDQQGHIWISHAYKGVYRIALSPDGQSIAQVDFFNSQQGLPSDLSINVVKIQGELLFTTEKGVYYFEEETQQFQPHEAFNKMFRPDQPIHRLIEDESGNIWFSAGEEFGLLQVHDRAIDKKVEKVLFNKLQSRLVKGFEHVYAFDSNHIFIGMDEGFMLYNPANARDNDQPLAAYIREVHLIGHPDSLVFGGVFTQDNQVQPYQSEDEQFSFASPYNDIRIAYSSAYYKNISDIQYQIFLEGWDPAWSSWTHKTEKDYTNLPHGTYSFHVKAKNIYGTESEIATFRFTIETPWYATAAATIGYILTTLLLLWGIFRISVRKVKQEAETMKREQTIKLRKKEVQFQQEARRTEAEIIRLRNEKLQSEINHKNKELASAAMHLVQKGEILHKIKQDLDKLTKTSDPTVKKQINQLSRAIDSDIKLDKNWEQFEYHFDQVHEQFLQRLRTKYPFLTPKDQKLCAYLRMNISTKEIAPLMNISVRGVEISRYRLRKKLALEKDANLVQFMLEV